MNTLRKIAQWIWLNKERMVLAVMVLFLIYRVYEVVYPEESVDEVKLDPPKPRGEIGVRSVPPVPPAPPPAPDLTRRHPFVWVGVNQGITDDDGGPRIDLQLLQIMENRGVWQARFRSPVRTYWMKEGDKFETYEVVEINPDEKTVVIYAHNINDSVVLTVE